MIKEILDSLASHDVRIVVVINDHGDKVAALTEVAMEARKKHGIICAICQCWDILSNRPLFGHSAKEHAGYGDTAPILASRPEASKMERVAIKETKQVDKNI